ncbi:type II secretion system F family protein (plasmid) [Escherichia coli]|uniref:type II secretion system F family protein n=1 Tax=Enterobacteriaceae TaxID=543 RepID=UPI0009730F25|nr:MULTISPECIES: type II secretion system F family protein [Enterobacteriaceae]MDS1455425.1 type II secretion system F family protein [Escherichia coli]MDS1461110.1 type II secretion system F family protein [Escherichia coli]SIZ57747.1 Cholera toxin secretion protein epsF [Shigella sonnei]SJF75044.1 Cholera toxin secretion protein epsF [Shigella sonnei]
MNISDIDAALTRLLFTTKLRIAIYEKLCRYIDNGVPLVVSLEEMHRFISDDGKKIKKTSAVVVMQWLRALRNGDSFSSAVEGWVPADEISIISSGEISGDLRASLKSIILMNETKKKIRSALSGALYPLALLASTCFFLYIFGSKVVPAFAQVLPVEQWKGTGHTMYLLSEFVRDYLLMVIILFFLIVVTILSTLSVWTGEIRKKIDVLPPWSIYKSIAGCGFLLSLASLLNAGIPAPESIRIIFKTASPWYKERLVAIRQALFNGAPNIGEALYLTGFNFPTKNMVMDIRTYAALDGFETMLNKLSVEWQEDTVKFINTQMDIFKNAAIIIMGGVFMWIVSGMFALEQQISNAAQLS